MLIENLSESTLDWRISGVELTMGVYDTRNRGPEYKK